MNTIEWLPIIATTCLIIGDIIQLEKVWHAHNCRSVSLLKWVLSVTANTLTPFYYILNHHWHSAIVAIFLWLISLAISIIIVIRRKHGKQN